MHNLLTFGLPLLPLLLFAIPSTPAAAAASSSPSSSPPSWPNTPFHTSGRWLLDAAGANVTYAGVNWPAHIETMLPEGLQYQSIDGIVAQIGSLGMNAVRLTWAVQMVDEIYANGGQDVGIKTAFVDALGTENGTAVFEAVVGRNPQFGEETTRLQVFDAVAASLAAHHIYLHLDNHVSKSGWCCTPFDGNSWPGDGYFPQQNWTRALGYMAAHARRQNWTALASMSLRNELRQPLDNLTLYDASYNWATWYGFVRAAAAAVHGNNSDVLVFLGGLDSDTDLGAVVGGLPLSPGDAVFGARDFPGLADRLVLELHYYDGAQTNCTAMHVQLATDGFRALNGSGSGSLQMPVMMTEWGFAQDNATWRNAFAACLEAYLPAQRAGWFVWVLAGSYYVRTGVQDADEPWGLLSHDWSAWRNPGYVAGGLGPMVGRTLAYLNGTGSGGGGGGGGGVAGSGGNATGAGGGGDGGGGGGEGGGEGGGGSGGGGLSTSSGASGRQEKAVASTLTTCLLAFGLAALFCAGMSL